jgi:2-methylcitrate dehydratase PrpD
MTLEKDQKMYLDRFSRPQEMQHEISRRTLLEYAGKALAMIALPRGAWALAQNAGPGPVITTLSDYMSAAATRTLPEEVITSAKLHLLDTLAAMISGIDLPPAIAAIRFARTGSASPVATVVGTNITCGPIDAALANGMLAHSDETDDSHAPSQSHPGCAVIPAALAAGERFGIDGARFLRAIALGYDVGTRVTMAFGGAKFQTDTHHDSHSTAGVFCAAAAAACAANLNSQQMRWVLDYTAQQTAGIAAWKRDLEHVEKSFVFAGMPSRNGVTAALVVQSGWTGVDDILSGSDNFLMAFAPQADPAVLIDKLGQRYEVVRTNIKKWSVGSPIQAPLDAMETLLKKYSFRAEQVKKVVVRSATQEAVIVDNRTMPDICLQHMIAVMLVDGTASFRSAHDQKRMHDPAILRERAKVDLISDEGLDRLLPKRVAVVEVTLNDGSHLTERVEAVRGTAENPMTQDEIVAKSRDLIAPSFGSARCTALIDRILKIEDIKNIRELRPLLQKA